MKRIAKYFFQGLLFLVPLAVTAYVFYAVFTAIDALLGIRIRGRIIPGVGFVIVVLGTTLIGFLSSNFLTRRIVRLVERLFGRLPLVKLLYSSLKDLIGAFVGDKKGFERPVLVPLMPDSEVKVAGFVTRTDLSTYGMPEKVAVYVPQSYNFSGNLLIVPREQVTPLDLDSSKAMAFIVSGGVAAGQAEEGSSKT